MTHDDHAVARDLAAEAGALLLRLRAEHGFDDVESLRANGDRESHEHLVAALGRQRPGDVVLSEEGRDDPARLRADRVWIIDPLDGTREYGEEGRADWAVHVALWEKGRLAAGAVALPAQGRTLSTAEPPRLPPARAVSPRFSPSTSGYEDAPPAGGRSPVGPGSPGRSGGEGRPPAGSGVPYGGVPSAAGPEASRELLRVAVSRSRPPELITRMTGIEPVPLGSAGAKVAAVLLGEVDAYIHAGGQYEWDSAAPVAVALAAGAYASRIDGSPLTYNQPDPKLPDILVCHPHQAAALLAGIRTAI